MITHPDLEILKCPGGLFDVEPCAMDLQIGERGQRINPDPAEYGTIGMEPFTVVGVQKNYRGAKCWRIVYDSEIHAVGSVLDPNDPVVWFK